MPLNENTKIIICDISEDSLECLDKNDNLTWCYDVIITITWLQFLCKMWIIKSIKRTHSDLKLFWFPRSVSLWMSGLEENILWPWISGWSLETIKHFLALLDVLSGAPSGTGGITTKRGRASVKCREIVGRFRTLSSGRWFTTRQRKMAAVVLDGKLRCVVFVYMCRVLFKDEASAE